MRGLQALLIALVPWVLAGAALAQFGRPAPTPPRPAPTPPPRPAPTPPPRTTPIVPTPLPSPPPGARTPAPLPPGQTPGLVPPNPQPHGRPSPGRIDSSADAVRGASTVGLLGTDLGPVAAVSALLARETQPPAPVPPAAPPQPDAGPPPGLAGAPVAAQPFRAPGPSSDDGFPVIPVLAVVAAVLGIGGVVLSRCARASASPGQVRVVAIPAGEAPEHVRAAWVGLVLPLVGGQRGPSRQTTFGVLSNDRVGQRAGYAVNGRVAVELLASQDPDAAAWWRRHAPHVLEHGYELVFPAEVCEQVG